MEEKSQGTFRELLKFTKSCRVKLIVSVIIAILGVGCGMLPYIMIAKITNQVLFGVKELGTYMLYIAIILLGYTGKVVFHGISTTLSHQSAYTILKDIREKLTYKLSVQPLGAVLSKPVGEFKTIIVDTVERIEKPLAHIIPELTSNLLVPVFMFIYIAIIDFRVALLSLCTIPISLVFYKLLMIRYAKCYKDYLEANNHMNAKVVEYVNGIETIKAFNHSQQSYKLFSLAVENNRNKKIHFFNNTLWLYSAVMYIMPATLLFVLPGVLYFYMKGSLTIEALITCVVLSFGMMSPLIAAMNLTDGIASLKTTLNEVHKILDGTELHRPDAYVPLDHHQIEFKSVSFAYEDKNVLEQVSFKTIKNGMTAIVGSSGSGKSTIGKLIMNFWDTGLGEITLGGIDMKKIPLAQLNELIAYVSQDSFLFDMSLKENIKIGDQNASCDEINTAAQKASCHKFISVFEKGYDTMAGDAGGRLSGGEKQRVSLARSILKNSPVVVLDEATAYTDPENEVIIQDSINQLIKNKTLIVIAHRLSTIKNADQIIVMDKGQIVAGGTHDHLLTTSSYYRKLWHAYTKYELVESRKEVG